MGVIELSSVIEGAIGRVFPSAGSPATGTDEVQTLTFGGTPTGGTFILRLGMYRTAAISWSATNTTLVSNIDTALEAIAIVGASGVVTAVGSMTAGIGTITVTFSGTTTTKTPFGAMGVESSLTGTAPTLTCAVTTPGVAVAFKNVGKGLIVADTTNGKALVNSGTAAVPVWTVAGTQT